MVARLVLVFSLLWAVPAQASVHDQQTGGGLRNERMARLLLLVSMLTTAHRSHGSIANLDRENGFRDARFGASARSFHDLVRDQKSVAQPVFTRESESMQVGGARVDRIAYAFSDDQLCKIVIETTAGSENSEALLRAAQRSYGPGRRQDRAGDIFEWDGHRVHVWFEAGPAQARLVIRSKRIENHRRQAVR